MTEEEFLKLVNDFVRGQLCGSENWRYTCFSIRKEINPRGRREIVIQYNPYKVENDEAKEVKTLVRNCDVGTVAEQYKRFRDVCDSKDAQQCSYCELRGFNSLNCSRDKCYAVWSQMPYKPTGE